PRAPARLCAAKLQSSSCGWVARAILWLTAAPTPGRSLLERPEKSLALIPRHLPRGKFQDLEAQPPLPQGDLDPRPGPRQVAGLDPRSIHDDPALATPARGLRPRG